MEQKFTGITRRIDNLGRVVIPKEIRESAGWQSGTLLEIWTSDFGLCLQKISELDNAEIALSRVINMLRTAFAFEQLEDFSLIENLEEIAKNLSNINSFSADK